MNSPIQTQTTQPYPRLKPPALKPGANLAILSPASAAKPELVTAGREHLRSLGYRTTLAAHALDRGPLYFAGTLAHRVEDLHAAFADPTIDAILCTRGGWGSAELLPHLDRSLIRANPKPFIGYSDHTSLHTWLQNETGLVTFYGPMVAADFSRTGGFDPHSWFHSLHQTTPWSLTSAAGLRTLRPGATTQTAQGTLRGGCLSLLTESLGTPFAPRPSPEHPTILFLEDIATKPYQWDRMLHHLIADDQLAGVAAIVLGDMRQCVPPEEGPPPPPAHPPAPPALPPPPPPPEEDPLLEAAILHALRDFPGPLAIGLRSGHVSEPNITLPLGVEVQIDLSSPAHPQMHFLEAAVTI